MDGRDVDVADHFALPVAPAGQLKRVLFVLLGEVVREVRVVGEVAGEGVGQRALACRGEHRAVLQADAFGHLASDVVFLVLVQVRGRAVQLLTLATLPQTMRLYNGAVFVQRLHHLLDWCVPFEHPGLFRVLWSEPLNFLLVPLPVQLFVIVEMPAFGARDILGEERPHKINNICLCTIWVMH